MKYNEEHIYQLLLEKQLGEISRENDRYLQQVMLQDEHVRNCWMELENAKIATNNAFLEDLRADLAWCKVEALLRPAPPIPARVVAFFSRYRMAAAFVGALILSTAAAFYLWQQRDNTPAAPLATVPHAKPAPAPATAATAPAKSPKFVAGNIIQSKVSGSSSVDSNALAKQIPEDTGRTALFVSDTTKATEDDDAGTAIAIEWNTLTVPSKTDYKFELSDGTEVHLNASSTLRFPFIFPGKTREVYLEGEAYFIVAKNSKQPFIVHTPSTSVKALGTAFNINSYDTGIVVTSLVQGAAVTDVGDSLDVTLKPGYEAIYKTGERFKVKRFDENVTLSWREGVYRFNNQRLIDLEPVVQRWFGVKVAFGQASISTLQYTGYLSKGKPLTDFLDQLSQALNIEYHIYDNTIHFDVKKKRSAG
jgi:transmembrane sensor